MSQVIYSLNLGLKVENNMYDTKMEMIYKKRLYGVLYLSIHRIDDYQRLCHSAPLQTPANSLKIINQRALKRQEVCLARLPSDHNPEADSVLGRGGNKRGPHIYNKQHERIHGKGSVCCHNWLSFVKS